MKIRGETVEDIIEKMKEVLTNYDGVIVFLGSNSLVACNTSFLDQFLCEDSVPLAGEALSSSWGFKCVYCRQKGKGGIEFGGGGRELFDEGWRFQVTTADISDIAEQVQAARNYRRRLSLEVTIL